MPKLDYVLYASLKLKLIISLLCLCDFNVFHFHSSWVKEPDNIAGNENCAVLRTTGVFSDRNCNYATANYACKKPQSTCEYLCHIILCMIMETVAYMTVLIEKVIRVLYVT